MHQDKLFYVSEPEGEFASDELDRPIPQRFENVVARYPERIAVKMADRTLTYAELNRAANRIARQILNARGPGSEPIALLFEHDIDAIVAILAVLKAGKFYLALNPSFPSERNSYMLADSGASVMLTHSPNLERAQNIAAGRTVLNIDADHDRFSPENLQIAISNDDLSTLIYTSGSTGQPKGAPRAHRNTGQSARESPVFATDRLTLLHSLSFGSASDHLYASLLNGAALCPFDVKSQGVDRLANWLRDEAITICHLPPALFRQLAEALFSRPKLSALRLIRLSGAPITRQDFELYKKSFSATTLLKIGMGSTEAGRISSAILDQRFAFPDEGTAAGYPRPEKRVLLLDDDGHEVAPNEIGEIAVKGRGLAAGYWNKPELTSVKFTANSGSVSESVYRTGDLGRLRPDGFLIHLGRKDLMVKIRGYRVELGEIEGALLAHPTIREAGVVAWEREQGEKYLAAYIVVRGDSRPTISELNDFLKDKLPDYMIPAAYTILDFLPRTNGKLDRTALPLVEHKRPDVLQPYVPPSSEIERTLVHIWEEVLEIRPIGIHDNFFDLGGHSLLATRVLSRLRDSFQVNLPVSRLFEAATVAVLADYIERTRAKQFAETATTLVPSGSRGPLPLSYAQQRLWFLDQLEPESRAYNLTPAYQLSGQLDTSALERTINEIVRRHEILRTVIRTTDGSPYQLVLTSLKVNMPVIDLRDIDSEDERAMEVQRLYIEQARLRFDLITGPLLRVTLLRLTEDNYVLILAVHHIVYDGWSMGVFARELSELYDSFANNKPPALAEPPIQYGDFAKWQHQSFQGEFFQEQLRYWKKHLENLPTLHLPSDKPRPALQTFYGARQTFALSNELTEALKKFDRRAGVTLFMTLLAAFQTLMHRYTGQDDIVIGSPVAGRSHKEFEGLIGFFLNMLVLRGDLSGNPTFREFLARVRNVCLDAYAHQEMPFEKLVEELQPDRDLSHNPLFQVTFTLQNTPRTPFELAGVKFRELELSSGTARFDLHLFAAEEDGGIRGYFSYNTDLFNGDTIRRLSDHFQLLLQDIVAHPDRRLADLAILTNPERQQLLIHWNDTKRDDLKGKLVLQSFEEQVERDADAVGLYFEEQRLTYRELNQRANQLARYLAKLGVRPEVAVGICVQRSAAMIVAMLGVLKAGGAYVPLDPNYPKDRLTFMLEDTQAQVVLTQLPLRKRLPDRGAKVLCLDSDWHLISQQSAENLACKICPENLAYVIYTSGSTGQPKGVAIEHRNLAAFLSWVRSAFTREDLGGVLASTSICFDLSIFEIFAPLTCGGTVIMADNALALTTHPDASKITLINTVPSALDELLRLQAIPPSVRVINLAGETVRTDLVRRIYRSSSALRVHDLYGPSECTTYSTWAIRMADGPQTIGRPIANTQIYILDAHCNPVPIGVVGEICIGGDGVARGYLNRPELTVEKFIYHSFDGEPPQRLYRTGDLGRYFSDGNIELIGRVDNQVKIRGYRIELGEIEAALGQHPSIRESVVLAPKDTSGVKRLVAYVVPTPGSDPTGGELRGFMQRKLPDHMVPSIFVPLDKLPTMRNGKVDRGALPPPGQSRSESADPYQKPRTPTEDKLTCMWAELLNVETIGIHDNFFELGGHSLLATRLVSRIRSAFSIELPLRSLFDSPTVAEIAAIITQNYAHSKSDVEIMKLLTEVEGLLETEANTQHVGQRSMS